MSDPDPQLPQRKRLTLVLMTISLICAAVNFVIFASVTQPEMFQSYRVMTLVSDWLPFRLFLPIAALQAMSGFGAFFIGVGEPSHRRDDAPKRAGAGTAGVVGGAMGLCGALAFVFVRAIEALVNGH